MYGCKVNLGSLWSQLLEKYNNISLGTSKNERTSFENENIKYVKWNSSSRFVYLCFEKITLKNKCVGQKMDLYINKWITWILEY